MCLSDADQFNIHIFSRLKYHSKDTFGLWMKLTFACFANNNVWRGGLISVVSEVVSEVPLRVHASCPW